MRIDLGGAERDDGGARRQADQLGRAGIGQLRQARPGLDLRAGHQAAAAAARMVSAPRNIVSTMPRACSRRSVNTWPRSGSAQSWISSTATNSACAVERHRLDRAGEPARVRRDDLLLAGDQRDVARALARHHAVVVLARQQAQREADDAGGMGQHPLDREMRLAGVRRAQDGLDAGGETGVGAEHGSNVWMPRRGMQAEK